MGGLNTDINIRETLDKIGSLEPNQLEKEFYRLLDGLQNLGQNELHRVLDMTFNLGYRAALSSAKESLDNLLQHS